MDGMTIDEAIKYCEETAYQNEILMKRYDDASGYNRSHNEKIRTDGAKGCEQLMSLHRQLASWLKELKAYREDTRFADLYERICVKRDDDIEYFARTKDKTYITRIAEKEMFIHMMQDMMFDRYGVEEVNADESSRTN